jgi:hypothetical protein
VQQLAERLEKDATDPIAQAVGEEAERLLLASHSPTFWDDPERARSVLGRYYQLDRCMMSLKALGRRVQGLTDVAGHMQLRRDGSRLAEVRGAIEEIENASDLLRLEIAGAAAGSEDRAAVLRTSAIGPGADDFAAQLLAMYAAWGERTGRQVTRRSSDHAIEIAGLASYELLVGEQGLHRLVTDQEPTRLARVSLGRGGLRDEPALDGDVIVRQYHGGTHRFVRDPRTGVRVSGITQVLVEGKIDPFLLETARRRSAERS